MQHAANSPLYANRAIPGSLNMITRATPNSPVPPKAAHSNALSDVPDQGQAHTASNPARAKPMPGRAASSSSLASVPAASSSRTTKAPPFTGAVWQSLQAFVQGRLPGGRKRTHSQAFVESQATADSAADVESSPPENKSGQHADPDKLVNTASNSQAHAEARPSQQATPGKHRSSFRQPVKSGCQDRQTANKAAPQGMYGSAVHTGAIDLTVSDSEGKAASQHSTPSAPRGDAISPEVLLSSPDSASRLKSSSKKRQGRRGSGAGSDPIEIDFTTSDDTSRQPASPQNSKFGFSHGVNCLHAQIARQPHLHSSIGISSAN